MGIVPCVLKVPYILLVHKEPAVTHTLKTSTTPTEGGWRTSFTCTVSAETGGVSGPSWTIRSSQLIRDTSGQMNCITFLIGFDSLSAPLPGLLPLLQPQPPLPHLHLSMSSHSQFISSVLPLPLSHDPPIHSHPVSNMFLTLMPKRLCNTATKTLGGGREYIALLANLYFLFVLPVFILNNGDYKACHTTPTGVDTS